MSKEFFIDAVKLNSGCKMPRLGFGTWELDDDTVEACVYHALKVGYRLIDTARYYRNEIGVGKAIRRAIDDGIARREEIFVTSKIMPGGSPDAAIDASIRDLRLTYVDLMLIHWSGSNDAEVYRALERGVKAGKVRSIGISNYNTPRAFDKIRSVATIVPAVVQNENHPYSQSAELQAHVAQFGTVVESWYPFGGRGNTQKIFGNDTIQRLAQKYSKSPAQIVLRWHMQAGFVAIPGSSNAKHIADNFDVFDFELTADDMKSIRALDKGRRFENWS